MRQTVSLTIFLAVLMAVVTLIATVSLVVMYYVLYKRKSRQRASSGMLKPSPLPVVSSRTLPQLTQQDYAERFYSGDSDESLIQPFYTAHYMSTSTPDGDYSLDWLDELSDHGSLIHHLERRRSSAAISSSSRDETDNNGDNNTANHTPTSSASENSPIMSTHTCYLNLSLNYDYQEGALAIGVINASSPPRNLCSNAKGLFIVIQLFQKKPSGDYEDVDLIFKTDMKPYSTNVLFNETFRYEEIPHDKLKTMSIRFSLCSHDRFSRVQTIGDFIVSLNDPSIDPVQGAILQRRLQPEVPLTMQEKEKGELSVSLRYKRGSGRINVIVLKANNLKKPKKFMSNDPYVTVKLMRNHDIVTKKKTKVKKGCSNPCWNEPFVFDLAEENLLDYSLVFAVKGRDLFTTRTRLGSVCVGPKAPSTGVEHWNESICSKNTMRQVTMTHRLV